MIDNFLPAALVASLLDYALANRQAFAPAGVTRDGATQVDLATRLADLCDDGLGPHRADFKAAVHARFDDIAARLGVPHFAIARTELQLVAHGDNAFYRPHIDTHTGINREHDATDRVISLVYYFHREPKRFAGGEIALFPFGNGSDATAIEPLQNRLVAFPSFALHEVRRVSCPSGDFADSRFAVSCWLRRDKVPSAAAASLQP